MLAAKDSVYAPFSSNFGIGYPVTDNAQALYDEATFATALTRTCMLLPCIAIAFVGLAGVFNVIKYHMLGANVKVWKEFFKGVKNNWFVHLWIGAIAALAYFLLEMSICGFGVPSFPLGWKIALIVISSLIILTVLTFAMFIITQSALYYLPMGKMIKNAALFVRSFPLQNLLIMIACRTVNDYGGFVLLANFGYYDLFDVGILVYSVRLDRLYAFCILQYFHCRNRKFYRQGKKEKGEINV